MKRTVGILLATALVFAPHGSELKAESRRARAVASARELSRAFEDVAEEITRSLVSIKAVKRAIPMSGNGLPQGIFPFQLPPGLMDELQKRMPQAPTPNEGMGTGFVVDMDGHIITNNHVIDGADEVTVVFHDKRELKAEVIGQDPRTDVAVLRVERDDLVPAALGDSDKLRIGEWVIAAGSPFGLENSITAGIVSAKGRSLARGFQLEDFIQTDAAINPGNSGGPLLTLDGRVVGINTAIFSRSGGYMGIGFAIPVNMARQVVTSLIKDGKVTRGWLGVSIQDLTPDLAASFDFGGNEGALVGDVTPDSPAAKGGLLSGDILLEFGSRPVRSVNDLQNIVAGTLPGTEVNAKVFRDGAEEMLRIQVGELEGSPLAARFNLTRDTNVRKLGLKLSPLTDEKRKELGIESSGGVLVAGVEPYSPAAKAGLAPDDVIVKVGKQDVSSPTELKSALKKSDARRGIRLVLEQDGMKRFAVIKEE